ncbi:MAG: PrgI family protein [Candidatus Saccharimonas sp.]
MAVYKVAQDVEADDKLIGPFSFRQFIYLIIVALAIVLGWGLSQLSIILIVIPAPIILFFGALALPLRKDQPMEVYMAALVSFYLKPRKRLWIPDGIESLVEITAPKVIEVQRAKDITQSEAERRLSYLADIADTQGWAVRHAAQPMVNSSLESDVFFAAQQTEDVLDESGGIAASFGTMIAQTDERRRHEVLERMQHPATSPVTATSYMPINQTFQPVATQQTPATEHTALTVSQPNPVQTTPFVSPITASSDPAVQYNPYPAQIRQTVIQPLGANTMASTPPQSPLVAPVTPTPVAQPTTPEPISTSETTVSPDIISLASNTDLSIETIQREAARIQKKADENAENEVYISLH